jgi:Asp/Glu/hydantoin racemase
MIAARFGIVTTVQPAVPGSRARRRHGAARLCGVRAADEGAGAGASQASPIGAFATAPSAAAQDAADAIILGCAGMSALGRAARDLGCR